MVLIQKTPASEFNITLTKKERKKTSFWACGKSGDVNTKKVYSTVITGELLKTITNKSKKNDDVYADIEDFLRVDPKEFINLLKIFKSVE